MDIRSMFSGFEILFWLLFMSIGMFISGIEGDIFIECLV